MNKFLNIKKFLLPQNENSKFKSIHDINNNFGFKEQQRIQERKLNQINKLIGYNIPCITYFDFFSFDAFEIIKNSKQIADYLKINYIRYDHLFLSFFGFKFDNKELLKLFDITNITKILKINNFRLFNINNFLKRNKKPLFFENLKNTRIYDFFSKSYTALAYFFNIKKNDSIKFDDEILYLFKKSTLTALLRFKEPIITPEIIILTIIEENKLNIHTLMCEYLRSKNLEIPLLRFYILKDIASKKRELNNQLSPDQLIFGYLLKTQISEKIFNELVTQKVINKYVLQFKNLLISKCLNTHFLEDFNYETHVSISLNKERFYSQFCYD